MINKNLNSILASFQKTISQLDSLVDKNDAKCVKNAEKLSKLKQDNDALAAESQEAVKVADRLRSLIGEK